MSNFELVEGGLLEEWLLMYFKFKEEHLKTCITSTRSRYLGNSVPHISEGYETCLENGRFLMDYLTCVGKVNWGQQ